jgi:hypothetical protein
MSLSAQPFLPWRLCRDRSVSYAHCFEPPDEGFAVRAVPIANDISRRLLPIAGFGQLARDPFGVRMNEARKEFRNDESEPSSAAK